MRCDKFAKLYRLCPAADMRPGGTDGAVAYHSLNSFGSNANALTWVGQTADTFKGQFGPLPGRLQKLYTSYSEASDALNAYWPQLQTAQTKADSALRQAQDANAVRISKLSPTPKPRTTPRRPT